MKLVSFFAAILLASWAPDAAGQHFLSVEDGGKMAVVVAAHGLNPMVLHGDKPVVVRSAKFAVGQGGEYLTRFVAVRHPKVTMFANTLNGNMDQINRDFDLQCEFETAYQLENVFVVIVLHTASGDSGLFLMEVGRLEARTPHPVHARVPMNMDSELGNYDLYVFSGGRELFHSMMPMGEMEAALDKMVRERIEKQKDSPMRPFVGPAPEYPKALYRQKITGNAVVEFVVGPRGGVIDPKVVSATQPEFGEAALAAIRQWWFIPRVKNGSPVETRASLPFEFSPPKG